MTDYVIRTKDKMIYFGDYEEEFDTKILKDSNIVCAISEDGDRWVERINFVGKEYDFDFKFIERDLKKSMKNRDKYLAEKVSEELGEDD